MIGMGSMKKSLSIAAAGFIATAVLLSIAAPAQVIRGHDTTAPVGVDAGRLEASDRDDRVILSGGVTITQAGLKLNAARLTAAYTDNAKIDVNRFDAVGGVTITKDDLRATSNAAIYDVDGALITLIGNVNLQQGANRLSGGRMIIDLRSDRTSITGGADAAPGISGGNNGRVTGTFKVPQRKN